MRLVPACIAFGRRSCSSASATSSPNRTSRRSSPSFLDADPWQLIVPAKVYHELQQTRRCCGCVPNVVDIIVRVTENYHLAAWVPTGERLTDVQPIALEKLHGRYGSRRSSVKGEAQVIERLNEALFLELGAVNQYWVHFRLLDDWGFTEARRQGARRIRSKKCITPTG